MNTDLPSLDVGRWMFDVGCSPVFPALNHFSLQPSRRAPADCDSGHDWQRLADKVCKLADEADQLADKVSESGNIIRHPGNIAGDLGNVVRHLGNFVSGLGKQVSDIGKPCSDTVTC